MAMRWNARKVLGSASGQRVYLYKIRDGSKFNLHSECVCQLAAQAPTPRPHPGPSHFDPPPTIEVTLVDRASAITSCANLAFSRHLVQARFRAGLFSALHPRELNYPFTSPPLTLPLLYFGSWLRFCRSFTCFSVTSFCERGSNPFCGVSHFESATDFCLRGLVRIRSSMCGCKINRF